MKGSTMAKAGYYDDPFETDGVGRLRWWGGGTWADQTLPPGGEWAPGDAKDHPPDGVPVDQDVIDAAKARSPRVPPGGSGPEGSHRAMADLSTPGLLGIAAGWLGVLLLAVGGFQMIDLRSISGDSVAEAFYNAMGLVVMGAAAALASSLLRRP